MRLVERHIVKDNRFEGVCQKSGLLYNYVLYQVRQGIFSGNYLKEYDLSSKLCRDNQFDFRNLPSTVSQQVVKQVFQNIKGWIKLKKDYEKNPSKYEARPGLPKYKKRKKQNMLVFTTSACRVRDGYIHFIKNIVEPIKTNIGGNELYQVRIIPQATCYVVEVIYEKKESDLYLNKSNILSISNVGLNPFIMNGKVIKSFNQWFNKKRAKWMGFVGNKGTSNRLKWLNNYRNFWIDDKIHKVSRWIINFCKHNNVGSIVIGLNKGWKQNIDLGKKNNQKFVEIPFSKLIDKIIYKGKLMGIKVQTTEESYTSKIDHLAFESLKKQEVYLGRREKRGLFQSSIGKLINADVNGAIGIGRKVFGDSFVKEIIDSGFAFNPVRVNIL